MNTTSTTRSQIQERSRQNPAEEIGQGTTWPHVDSEEPGFAQVICKTWSNKAERKRLLKLRRLARREDENEGEGIEDL